MSNKYDEPQHELSESQAEALENALSQERASQANSPKRAIWAGEDNAFFSVMQEREKQRKQWGDDHDDEHGFDVLAQQAASYLRKGQNPLPSAWAHKSKVVDRDPRRVQMVKGAALAVAAIQAYDRAVRDGKR